MLGYFGEMLESGIRPALRIVPCPSGVAGPLTLTGIKKGDSLLSVLAFGGSAVDGLLTNGAIAISATAEKFKTTQTALYRIGGIQYSKAATDNLTFSAAYTINNAGGAGQLWGAFLVQINAAGTISTKAAANDQVYASQAAALAALPAPDAGNVYLAVITVRAKEATKWTANTDDMTGGSDCTTSGFTDGASVSGTVTGITDLTSQFTVTADNTIDNTGGTATTGYSLMVVYATTGSANPGFNGS